MTAPVRSRPAIADELAELLASDLGGPLHVARIPRPRSALFRLSARSGAYVARVRRGAAEPLEYDVLERCQRAGVPAPRPVLIARLPTSGDRVEVTTALPGVPFDDAGGSGEAWDPGQGRAVGRLWDALHAVDPAGLPRSGLAGARAAITRARDRWRARLEPDPLLRPVADVLDRSLDMVETLHHVESDYPHRIVHGDATAANVLVDGDRIAGLVDFEFAHLGDPVEDLARWDQSGLGPPLAELMAGYTRRRVVDDLPLRLAYHRHLLALHALVACLEQPVVPRAAVTAAAQRVAAECAVLRKGGA